MYFIILLIIIIILIIFYIYFNRLPCYKLYPNDFEFIKSPSWGTIMDIHHKNNKHYIAIFLSPLDVHYQYFPINGKIKSITPDYTGKFKLAYKLNKSNDNEKVIHLLENHKKEQIKVTQIAGFLPRMIEWYRKENDKVIKGDLMGMILFGSRVDIEIPNSYKLLIKKGDKVIGGETNIASY